MKWCHVDTGIKPRVVVTVLLEVSGKSYDVPKMSYDVPKMSSVGNCGGHFSLGNLEGSIICFAFSDLCLNTFLYLSSVDSSFDRIVFALLCVPF